MVGASHRKPLGHRPSEAVESERECEGSLLALTKDRVC